MDTRSWPQRVNSDKLNLFIMDTTVIRWISNPDQVCLHWVNPVWLMSCAKWVQKPSHFAKGVQRNITDFFKAWMTTDSLKIFYTCKIVKDTFRIVLYVTTFHAVLRCSSFRFKTVICLTCTYFVAEMYNVACYWKTVPLFCELRNLNAV